MSEFANQIEAELRKKERSNAVRQILMNELGLTREIIREEIRTIVKETLERYFSGDELRKFEARLTAELIRAGGYHLQERIAGLVKGRISISVGVKE